MQSRLLRKLVSDAKNVTQPTGAVNTNHQNLSDRPRPIECPLYLFSPIPTSIKMACLYLWLVIKYGIYFSGDDKLCMQSS